MLATKLNIHFHNPNSDEDTYKMVSGVLAELCVDKIKKVIIKEHDNSNYTDTENEKQKFVL